MKIAIIGAGNVGGSLGTASAQKAGHEIFFGVREANAEKTLALVRRIGGKARAGTRAEAAAIGDFIVLTVPWRAAEAATRSMRIGVQDAQHHRLRQHGRSRFSRRQAGDVRRRRRCGHQAKGDRAGGRPRLRRHRCGPLRNARLLEAHAMLWIDLALRRGLGRDWAFARVRR